MLYVTPWKPLMTGSLYENWTTPGSVASILSRLLLTGDACIVLRSSRLTDGAAAWAPCPTAVTAVLAISWSCVESGTSTVATVSLVTTTKTARSCAPAA